jgi:hypothetical protein
MKRAIVVACLMILAGAGGYALAEAQKNPLDEPLVMTKGEWIEAACFLASGLDNPAATYRFDREKGQVIVTLAWWVPEANDAADKAKPNPLRPQILRIHVQPGCARLQRFLGAWAPEIQVEAPEN